MHGRITYLEGYLEDLKKRELARKKLVEEMDRNSQSGSGWDFQVEIVKESENESDRLQD